jgi:tetratricopeptide (TPR) repeat protein
LHNVVDFSLEIPGVVMAATICVGLIVSGTAQDARGWIHRWAHRPTLVAAAASLVAILAATLVLTRGGELIQDREELHAGSLSTSGMEHDAFRARLRHAMLDHPAEPYFPFLGAARAEWEKRESVVPWVARVLERARVYPPAHLVLARSLRRESPAQARLEYRLYQEQGGATVIQGLPVLRSGEIASLVSSYDDALEIAPAGIAGAPVLEDIASRLADRLPSTRAKIDRELLRRDAGAVEPTLRVARESLTALQGEPWCSGGQRACADAALRAGQRAVQVAPRRCTGYMVVSRVAYTNGDVDGAIAGLRRALDQVDDRAACLRELAELANESNRAAAANDAIDHLARLGCGASGECLDNLLMAAQLELGRGNRNRALVFIRRATAVAPEDDAVTSMLAQSAASAGFHAEAADAFEKLARRHPEEPSYGRRAAQERTLVSPIP